MPGFVPLVPKNPAAGLRVLVLGRISTPQQDLENIRASYEDVYRVLKPLYSGPMHVRELGEQGSGMLTERESILEAEAEIATGTWDLVIMEDLSKAYRNPRFQYAFVQNCVDAGTRVICTGDGLDTADPNWEVALGAATLRHGLHIPDTRRRVRRTATHAFHGGGMVMKVRFSYRKLTKEKAASGAFGPVGLRIAKIATDTPVIHDLRGLVLEGAGPQELVDWLTESGIGPGPYAKSGKWTARMVSDLLNDPILSGTRTFRDVVYEPIFKTGKHRRVRNAEPETEYIPELAHMTMAEQEEMLAALEVNSRQAYSHPRGRDHVLFQKPRTHSIFPAQHARCAACSTVMQRTLHDQIKCPKSKRAENYVCWNRVQVRCDIARAKILSWLLSVLEEIPAFRTAFLDRVWELTTLEIANRSQKLDQLRERIRGLEAEGENLAAAIGTSRQVPQLVKRLKKLNGELKSLRKDELEQVATLRDTFIAMSKSDVLENPLAATVAIAKTSWKFANLMRRLIPSFQIVPVQALDSGQVRPRARLELCLTSLVPEKNSDSSLMFCGKIDLFEPPVHIKHLKAVLDTNAQHPEWSLKVVAAYLGIGHMTVKRSLGYARMMKDAGAVTPYVELDSAPDSASRWKNRPRKAS